MKTLIKKFLIFISLLFKGSARAATEVINPLPTTTSKDTNKIVDKTFQTQWTQDIVNEFPDTPVPVYSSKFGSRTYIEGDLVPSYSTPQKPIEEGTLTLERDEWLPETIDGVAILTKNPTPLTSLSTDNEELRKDSDLLKATHRMPNNDEILSLEDTSETPSK